MRERVFEPAGMSRSRSTTRIASQSATAPSPHARLEPRHARPGRQRAARQRRRMRPGRRRRPAACRSAPTTWPAGCRCNSPAARCPGRGAPVQRGAVARDVDAARCWCRSARCPAPITRHHAAVQHLCAGLERAGLSRHQAWSCTAARCSACSPTSCWCPNATSASPSQINSEESAMMRGLGYELLDHYLGFDRATAGRRSSHLAPAAPAGRPGRAAGAGGRSRPGRSVAAAGGYAGNYADPWYGTIDIRRARQAAHRLQA